MTCFRFLLALCIYAVAFAASAADKPQKNQVPEYCGKSSAAPSGRSLRWDCAGAGAGAESIAALEVGLRDEYSLTHSKDSEFKVYASKQSKPFSAWIVSGTKAARYRAIFQDDVWQGVGVTTYCEASPSECAAFEAFSASAIPKPLFFQLGPPLPEAPEIVH